MLIIKDTKNGKGLFARKMIPANKLIFKVKGRLLKADDLAKQTGSIVDNSFRFGPDTYLSPQGEIGDFLNHSCNPNSGVRKIKRNLWIFSIKKISLGEEVTIDYSTILAFDDFWRMRCRCGSKNCRKIIRRFNTIPAKLQTFYLRLEAVPSYIQS